MWVCWFCSSKLVLVYVPKNLLWPAGSWFPSGPRWSTRLLWLMTVLDQLMTSLDRQETSCHFSKNSSQLKLDQLHHEMCTKALIFFFYWYFDFLLDQLFWNVSYLSMRASKNLAREQTLSLPTSWTESFSESLYIFYNSMKGFLD